MKLTQSQKSVLLWSAAVAIAGSAKSQAASVSLFGAGKAQAYEQTSDSNVSLAEGSAYSFKAFAVPADSETFGLLQPPGSPFPMYPLENTGDILLLEQNAASQSSLDTSFGNGTYGFSFFSSSGAMESGSLSLAAGTYPSAPKFSNFGALQSVDAAKDLALTWNAFAGAGANDFVQVTIADESGDVVFQTGLPGQASALSASAQSVTVPANTLTEGAYRATIAFNHVLSRDTAALAGAIGLTTLSSATSATIQVGEGGGNGGGDTVPPRLVSVLPSNNALNVGTNSPVVFTFSEEMAASQSVNWNFAGALPSNFQYTWSADQKTLTFAYLGGFPASTPIVWSLDPSEFKDKAGNQLAATANLQGFFMTASGQNGGGTNDLCSGSADTGIGSFTVYRMLSYEQTGSSAPVLAQETPAFFSASVNSPTNNPVTQATLTLPNGSSRTLSNFFGRSFLLFAEFNSQEAMDAAFPSGTYTVKLDRVNGSSTASVQLGSSYPPTPQLSDFSIVQNFNATADQNFQWFPFTGVGANDHLSFTVHDKSGHYFSAPDPCVPRQLANTATSIVVPKGSLTAPDPIEGDLTFQRVSSYDTNTVPGIIIYSSLSKETSFKQATPNSGELRLENFVHMPDGSAHFQVKANAGISVIVEGSSDLKNWTTVSAGAAAGGTLDVNDLQAAGQSRRFYRAKSL